MKQKSTGGQIFLIRCLACRSNPRNELIIIWAEVNTLKSFTKCNHMHKIKVFAWLLFIVVVIKKSLLYTYYQVRSKEVFIISRVVFACLSVCYRSQACKGQTIQAGQARHTDKWTDKQTDATKCIISLLGG